MMRVQVCGPQSWCRKKFKKTRLYIIVTMWGLLVCVEKSISFLYDIVEGRIPKLSTVLENKNDD